MARITVLVGYLVGVVVGFGLWLRLRPVLEFWCRAGPPAGGPRSGLEPGGPEVRNPLGLVRSGPVRSGSRGAPAISTDRFVVVMLTAESFFNVGFSVSGWLVNHGGGADWNLQAVVSHQDDLL